VLDLLLILLHVTHIIAPSMEVTVHTAHGTNVPKVVVAVHKSVPVPVPTPDLNMAERTVKNWDHLWNDVHAKHNRVPGTPSSDHGRNVRRVAQEVCRRELEPVMLQDGPVVSTAPTSAPILKPVSVKPNTVQSTEPGEDGLHGQDAQNHVEWDTKQRAENATNQNLNMAESVVQVTIQ